MTTENGRERNPWLVLVALCLGFFMILLDTTIVNVVLPDIIDKVGTSLDEAMWVVNAYVLVYAVLLITAGRLGDIAGAAHDVPRRTRPVHTRLGRLRPRAQPRRVDRRPRSAGASAAPRSHRRR
ncbi:MAG: hypothetical protein GEV07_21320 [Streptosporangiales bacterium]|nr:hypothetical protein [Streptosporangiales bacterium]